MVRAQVSQLAKRFRTDRATGAGKRHQTVPSPRMSQGGDDEGECQISHFSHLPSAMALLLHLQSARQVAIGSPPPTT
jgi:hypothetical protein